MVKVAAAQISGVLRDPRRFAGILLHGEDPGLIRDRALAAARAVVSNLDDPFLSCVLLKEEHSRLIEEARLLSLVGGRRVVRVVDAGDGIAAAMLRLEGPADCALVVIEGGALAARSKLRQAAEKAAGWASIACYPQTGAALTGAIRQSIGAAGFSVTDDALAFLGRELAGDTVTRRSELEKLVLYASGAAEIDLDCAMQCCARGADASTDGLVAAAMGGDVSHVTMLLVQVAADGATGPSLIAGLVARLHRLLKIRSEIDAGREAAEAVRALQPPVFFRDIGPFAEEARRWPEAGLRALLADARSADIACKRAGSRDITVAGQLLLAVARRGARQGRTL